VSVDLLAEKRRSSFSLKIQDFKAERVLENFGKEEFIKGKMDLTASLSAEGSDWEEMIGSLSGEVTLEGKDLIVPSMDLDDVVAKMETSQKFNLIDLGAFFFVGPLGAAATHSYKVASMTYVASKKDSVINVLHSEWKVANGIMTAKDVAFTTKCNRIALRGVIDLPKQRFSKMTIAVVDAKGHARVTQIMDGPLSSPFKSPVSILEALTAAGKNVIKKVGKLAGAGKKVEREPFYKGVVPHPGPEPVISSGAG
jgi:AsmA protein